MAFNERLFIKYLYEHDNGLPMDIADMVVKYRRGPSIDISLQLDSLCEDGMIVTVPMDRNDPKHYHTLDAGDYHIQAKITPKGRRYYLDTFLEEDRDKKQKSIDLFIKLTFVAIALGAGLQYYAIRVTKSEGENNRIQLDSLQRKQTVESGQEIKIRMGDSVYIGKFER